MNRAVCSTCCAAFVIKERALMAGTGWWSSAPCPVGLLPGWSLMHQGFGGPQR